MCRNNKEKPGTSKLLNVPKCTEKKQNNSQCNIALCVVYDYNLPLEGSHTLYAWTNCGQGLYVVPEAS